ncbi:MAG: hypothetical protein ABIO69_02665 [Sphingomicrobium sp.]
MRTSLWLLPLCTALSACNMAVSDHPMFSAKDRLTTPLKDGLWVADDPDCAFDINLPKEKWRNCAIWTIISGNKFVEFSAAKGEDRPLGFLVAGGQPPIVQIDTIEDGQHAYLFVAVDPTGRDAAGAVTSLNLWGIACGTVKTAGSNQVDPYPGIDKACHPLSTDALRAAALASRPTTKEPDRMQWVRAEAR